MFLNFRDPPQLSKIRAGSDVVFFGAAMLKRLLVVEEDPDRARSLEAILRDRYRASFCRSIADAIVALEGINPDGILLDLSSRPADAVDFLYIFRRLPLYREIPAIGMMDAPDVTDIRPFLTAGFQAVVSRPALDPFAFLGALERCMDPGARPPGSLGPRSNASDVSA